MLVSGAAGIFGPVCTRRGRHPFLILRQAPYVETPETRIADVEAPWDAVSEPARVGSPLLVTELLTPEGIKIPLESTDKEGLIGELAALLARVSGVPEETDAIREAVLERERVLSTGIGDGVAIPHGKTGRVGELVLVAGITGGPVEFEALDDRPVRLVLMLVGPESAAGLHVKVLSRISRLLRRPRLRERLIEASSPGAFLSVIRDAESP